jgi:hypothetical protein
MHKMRSKAAVFVALTGVNRSGAPQIFNAGAITLLFYKG